MSVEIVLGPMFSGKSSYALSYIRRHKAIGKSVVAVKPANDTRYSQNAEIVTHDKQTTPCIRWDTTIPLAPTRSMLQADVIVIEEAQFFTGLYSVVKYLIYGHRKQILLVGLDGDSCQTGFKELLECIPLASHLTKLHALCMRCKDGTPAPFTIRLNDPQASQLDVGGADKYMSVCLRHLTE